MVRSESVRSDATGHLVRRRRAPGIAIIALGVSMATTACQLLIRDVSLGAEGDDGGDGGSDVATDAHNPADVAPGADAMDAATPSRCDRKLPDGGDRPGPAMVLMDASTPFCIDTTEVTNAQFNAYLVASGELIDVPGPCVDAGVEPPTKEQDPALASQPARRLTACYAWSFCTWAGKRMCGLVGDGGRVPYGDIAKSEWGFACANGRAQNVYPYGDTYDSTACNTETSGVADVGSFPRCRGIGAPFSEVVDIVGNVGEYIYDFADDGTGGAWGGAWDLTTGGCTNNSARNVVIFGGDDVGVRCCADP
jgi:formylglycine-generating enzyme